MLTLPIYRQHAWHDAVLGCLVVGGEMFYTLERPWLDNAPNVSCTPGGQYDGQFVERTASGRYRRVYWLRAVPGRSGILIHNGNVVAHSRGCILLGLRRGWIKSEPAVFNSRAAVAELAKLTGGRDVVFKIHDLWQVEARAA